ncbi:hypothetical protein [Parasphingorhabdus sp.]|uniref:hypothetical protein n=1 Tax=Parasphingorhabdus sp. TaxID=2709688 RepID=UPI002F94308F
MTNNQEPERGSKKSAGGFFLAVGCIFGAIGGGLLGQPVIGLLAGFAAGTLISIAIWYYDL